MLEGMEAERRESLMGWVDREQVRLQDAGQGTKVLSWLFKEEHLTLIVRVFIC